MNIKARSLAITTIALAGILTLSGCTTAKADLSLSNDIEITSIPEWSTASIKSLETNSEWKIQDNKAVTKANYNKDTPQGYMITSENCIISYDVTIDARASGNRDQDYLSKTNLYQSLDGSLGEYGTDESIEVATNADAKLELTALTYTRPSFAAGEAPDPSAPALSSPERVQDGEYNGKIAARVITSKFKNPYAMSNEDLEVIGSPAPASDEGFPVVSVRYECKDTPIDEDLWKTLVSDANIKIALKESK